MARIAVPIPGPLAEARFLARPNRFVVHARMQGRRAVAHLPDPGRLRELLVPGRRIWLRPAAGPARRTRWTAVLVETPDGRRLVSLDTTLSNRLVARALGAGAVDELRGWRLLRAEAPHGGSRFDFLLQARNGRRLYLEVKSVTLVEEGLGLFPDAVTARGARHVRELAAIARRGTASAAVLFVVQRSDARCVLAAREIDPGFADALAEARAARVRILARRCRVNRSEVVLAGRVPVLQIRPGARARPPPGA